jgi:hypothetical protein
MHSQKIGSSLPRLLILYLWWGRTESTNTVATKRSIAAAPDDDDCGSICVIIGREERSSRRTLAPVSLCPPQIPYDLTGARTMAAAVGSRRLGASATALPTAPTVQAVTSLYKSIQGTVQAVTSLYKSIHGEVEENLISETCCGS